MSPIASPTTTATTLEEALYTRLRDHVGLAALITWESDPTRVYNHDAVPQKPRLPFVVYQVISAAPFHAFGEDTKLTIARVQFTSRGASGASARAVDVQVRDALNRWRETVGSIEVQDTLLENKAIPLPFEFDLNEHAVVSDFRIPYRETA